MSILVSENEKNHKKNMINILKLTSIISKPDFLKKAIFFWITWWKRVSILVSENKTNHKKKGKKYT